MSEWQPISTAPRDGTQIIIWGPAAGHLGDEGAMVADYYQRSDGSSAWRLAVLEDGTSLITHSLATHWMPLPARPSPTEEEMGK